MDLLLFFVIFRQEVKIFVEQIKTSDGRFQHFVDIL